MWLKLGTGLVGAVAYAGVTTVWLTFSSTLYPYSISQPSSFQHLVIRDTATQQRVDFFFGAQGSALTNVNIAAARGAVTGNQTSYLLARDATHIRGGGTITILGKARRWTLADFHGLAGAWRIETTRFAAGGWAWRVTVSYSAANAHDVPLMEKMVRTFKLKSCVTHC